jgi:hypothetical protein
MTTLFAITRGHHAWSSRFDTGREIEAGRIRRMANFVIQAVGVF